MTDQARSDKEGILARRSDLEEPDDINKVARINALCPPGWRVELQRSKIAVFRPYEVLPFTTISGDTTARIVADMWRWQAQRLSTRLDEFQEGLADILGWPVPQLEDPTGASNMLRLVKSCVHASGRRGARTEAQHQAVTPPPEHIVTILCTTCGSEGGENRDCPVCMQGYG